jgi:hypothetical protein
MTREHVERAPRTSERPSAVACVCRLLDADIPVVAVVGAKQVGDFLVVGPLLAWRFGSSSWSRTVSQPLWHQPERVTLSCLHEWLPLAAACSEGVRATRDRPNSKAGTAIALKVMASPVGHSAWQQMSHPDGRHLASRIVTAKLVIGGKRRGENVVRIWLLKTGALRISLHRPLARPAQPN